MEPARVKVKLDPKRLIADFSTHQMQILMDRQQNSTFQKIPTPQEMQHISKSIDLLIKLKLKVQITTPGDDQIFLGQCDACKLVDQKNYTWNPQCDHRICRICIQNTLFKEFKGNVMDALESKVFCAACRKAGLDEKMDTYNKELDQWIKANPSHRKHALQPQYDVQASDSEDEEEEKKGEERKQNEEANPPEAPGKSSEIRVGHLKPIVPDQVKKYETEVRRKQQEEFQRLQEIQRYSRECKLCTEYKHQKDFISLTPCDHRFCRFCLFDALSDSINNGDTDRDSLVCPDCQSYLHYANITQILSSNIALIAQLKEEKHYNCYQHLDYCPQCAKYIFWDSNHDDQRCICNYEFCKRCLLGAHQDITCQQKIEAHKAQVQAGNENMKPNQHYGVCIKCFTFGPKQMGTQVAKCIHCKRFFCCECMQEFNGKHQCGVMISDEVMIALGIK